MSGPNTDNVARLASTIAGDALVLLGLLHELVGEGDSQGTADRLHAYALLVSRIGLLADRIAGACGEGRHRDPSMWVLWNADDARAFDELAASCKHKAVLG